MSDTDTKPETEQPAETQGAATEEQSIVVQVEHQPVLVLLDDKKRELLFEHIEKELAEFAPDTSTSAGREAIRRFASKITKTKTAADQAGLQLTEEWRTKTAAVNAARKAVKDRLTALAEQARQPLTDWEEAEEKRVSECETTLQELTSLGVVPLDASAEGVRDALARVEATVIDPAKFQGMTEAGIKAKNLTTELLNRALERIDQQEKERAELAELRRQAAQREEREKAEAEEAAREREQREAEERAEKERQEAEEARQQAEAEAEARRQREQEEAAQRAREAAERAAEEARLKAEREAEEQRQREREEAEAEHQRKLDEERREREAAEARARAAEEAAAAAQRQREQEARDLEAAKEAERQRRAQAEADQAHRTLCKREAKEAIMTVDGVSEDQAKAIVMLIISEEVPRVRLDWAAEPKVKKAEPEVPAQPATLV